MFFRFVKTYIVQRQLYFSHRQFIFIFWKPHLSNAILLFILKLGAYLTLRTRLTYFAMHIFCIFFEFWYTFGLLVVYFRVTFGTVFGFNTCLCCILYCIALCNHHNAIVSLPLYEAFYILDLLYVGFDYSYVLVYGSSSSNSLSSFLSCSVFYTIFLVHIYSMKVYNCLL